MDSIYILTGRLHVIYVPILGVSRDIHLFTKPYSKRDTTGLDRFFLSQNIQFLACILYLGIGHFRDSGNFSGQELITFNKNLGGYGGGGGSQNSEGKGMAGGGGGFGTPG